MRRYKLTVYYLDGCYDAEDEFIIEQEESSYPTTRWLAYMKAKEVVDNMEKVKKYTLERVL